MAYFKINTGELEAEIQIKLYDKNNKISKDSNTYHYDNGVLNQKMITNMIIGKRKINFPIEFPNKCNGVFVVTKDLDQYIGIQEIKNDSCTIIVRPHSFDMEKEVELQATGY